MNLLKVSTVEKMSRKVEVKPSFQRKKKLIEKLRTTQLPMRMMIFLPRNLLSKLLREKLLIPKKAEAKAARDAAANKKAADLKKYNEISGATPTPEATMGVMSFVQMDSPKDSEAPTNQSLVKP